MTEAYVRGVKESLKVLFGLVYVFATPFVVTAAIMVPWIVFVGYRIATGQFGGTFDVVDWLLLTTIIPWNVLVVGPAFYILLEGGDGD